ncbi:DUF317 domain-containing protein [Streptomyces acidiscabies]|uniref:DUF317 domain-containing protein n=1 Tax=Streptomyces acidiscabies TaxID=42234 RepID=A0AAP6BGK2_9ACTN|nr:DUF317 domain-containing protein [Streptomyces acidiscabies]MBP5935389.1 DUF317 domain-containing protein [Streptomyces sp. LBUM 1476]MBZ3916763.1 DUF317 domain-containing protein [Streptomyces acidiscabies]MDX2964363.1 DUF317 domain-containing protein [Streptomyces acidiscabies]MDX3024898.1 DUF317 domain-containing protein [Streptomyces acidiscabies]MDX3794186.1 DUF317 domain-containing protein [Streptomyces acidiscabies]
MEAPLYPEFPIVPPPAPGGQPARWWVGPRYLAGDDGRLYDVVADTLASLGWTSYTMVRGRHAPDEPEEHREVVRSTVLHTSPDGLSWAQWTLADEPIRLGERPIAWQISARAEPDSVASWSAYFTPDVPGEAVCDFLLALDARDRPAVPFAGPELVLDAVAAHGWFRDIGTYRTATDLTFTAHISLREMPDLIQDGDPCALTAEAGEEGPRGWQAWAEPVLGALPLWAASFSASVPHDLVAAFAASASSTAPVLRRVLPEATRERLLRAPAV